MTHESFDLSGVLAKVPADHPENAYEILKKEVERNALFVTPEQVRTLVTEAVGYGVKVPLLFLQLLDAVATDASHVFDHPETSQKTTGLLQKVAHESSEYPLMWQIWAKGTLKLINRPQQRTPIKAAQPEVVG